MDHASLDVLAAVQAAGGATTNVTEGGGGHVQNSAFFGVSCTPAKTNTRLMGARSMYLSTLYPTCLAINAAPATS